MVSTTLLAIASVFFLVVCNAAPTGFASFPVLDIHTLLYGFGSVKPPVGVQRYWVDEDTFYIPISDTPTSSQVSFPVDHLWELGIHSDAAHSGAGCRYSLGWVNAPANAGAPEGRRKHVVRSGEIGGVISSTPATSASSHITYLRGVEFPDAGLPRATATHIFFSFESCFVNRYIIRSQFNKWNGAAYLMDWSDAPLEGKSWMKDEEQFIARTLRWENADRIISSLNEQYSSDVPNLIPAIRDSTIEKPGFGWWGGEFYFDYSSFMTTTPEPAVANPILDLTGYIQTPSGTIDDTGAVVSFGFCRSGSPTGCSLPGSGDCNFRPTPSGFDLRSCTYGSGAAFNLAPLGQTSDYFVRFYFDIARSRLQDNFDCNIASEVPNMVFVAANYTTCYPPWTPASPNTNFFPQNISTLDISLPWGKVPSASVPVTAAPFFRGSVPATTESVLRIDTVLLHTRSAPGSDPAVTSQWAFPPYAKIWDPSKVGPTASSPLIHNIAYHSSQLLSLNSCRLDRELGSSPISNSTNIRVFSLGGTLGQLRCEPSSSVIAQLHFNLPAVVDAWSYPFIVLSDYGASRSASTMGYRVTSSLVPGTLFETAVPSVGSTGVGTSTQLSNSPNERQISYSLSEFGHFNATISIQQLSGREFSVGGWVQVHSGLPNACASSPCKNGGTCYNGWTKGLFWCDCGDHLTGPTCESDVVACAADGTSCFNGGVCIDHHGLPGFSCNCTAGWNGSRCERANSPCPMTSCLNGGTCRPGLPGTSSFTCLCPPGVWTGDWCEKPVSDCQKDPLLCSGNGNCSIVFPAVGQANYVCTCASGWTGSRCDIPSVCSPNPCKNGGVCEAAPGGRKCFCTSHFYGESCEYDLMTDRQTDCRYSYTPCAGDNSACTLNAAGKWACECKAYWTGPSCNIHTVCQNNPCKNNGVCLVDPSIPDQEKKPICQCTGNWFGDFCDESLRDYFDDCRFSATKCQNNGTCALISDPTSSAPARYKCIQCDPGWHGDFCELPDACVNGGGCLNGGVCSFVGGVTRCTCTGDYTGPTCAHTRAQWIDTKFAEYTHDCRFSGLECQNGGNCVQRADGSFACNCGPSSAWTGPTCEVAKVCNPNPCMNEGMCDLHNGAATCYCPGGFVGNRCQWSLASFFKYDCRLKPCENGGSCTATGKCVCDTNKWVGSWCEIPVVCQGHQCNGGQCISINGQAACLCPGNMFGDKCQFNIESSLSDCRTNPCANGGVCAEFGSSGTYVCNCVGGFSGEHCEISRHCNPNPCMNGGMCTDFAGTFACHCAAEWTGTTCTESLAHRLDSIHTHLTTSISSYLLERLSAGVNGDISTFQSRVAATSTKVTGLSQTINTLSQRLSSLDQDNKHTSSAVDGIYNNFASKSDTDEIHGLLAELLSPASTICYSLSLIATLFFFLMN